MKKRVYVSLKECKKCLKEHEVISVVVEDEFRHENLDLTLYATYVYCTKEEAILKHRDIADQINCRPKFKEKNIEILKLYSQKKFDDIKLKYGIDIEKGELVK